MRTAGGLAEWSAVLSDATSLIPPPRASRRQLGVLAALPDPVRRPGDGELLGHRPGARVVQHDLADAPRAELGEDCVEAPAAVAEGLGVGAVPERYHPVLHRRQVGPR